MFIEIPSVIFKKWGDYLQYTLVFGFIFALIVAIFAIYNYTEVLIKFPWGSYSVSQAIIILGSATFGAVTVLLFGIFSSIKTRLKVWELKNKIKKLEKELKTYKEKTEPQQADVSIPTIDDTKADDVSKPASLFDDNNVSE